MANVRWIAASQNVPQIDTYTVTGTWASGDTASVTCNNKTITVTVGTSVTQTDIAAILAAAIESTSASTDLVGDETKNAGGYEFGEFRDVTASSDGAVLTITSAQLTDGSYPPFTITVAETTAGSGSLGSVTATQAATGKHFFNQASNWEGGLPSNGDTIVFDFGSTDVRWGLNDTSSITGLSLTRTNDYTGDIGNEPTNNNHSSHPYPEYREQKLDLRNTVTSGTQVITIGNLNASTTASGKTYVDLGTVEGSYCYPLIYDSQAFSSTTGHAVKIAGGVELIYTIRGGSVEIGGNVSENQAGISTVKVTGASTNVRINNTAAIAALGSLTVHAGTVVCEATGSNVDVTQHGGTVHYSGATGDDVTIFSGSFYSNSNITDLVIHSGGTYAPNEGTAHTVTNCVVYKGYAINDSNGDISWSNGIDFVGCTPSDGTLNVKASQTWTPSAL